MLQKLELTSSCRKFLKVTTMYNITIVTLYFPTGYFVPKFIFPIPVVMALLIILDHLLVLTICIHRLSHPLSLCGITYQTVLKLLLSSYLRLTYHISKYCYLYSLCPFFDMNFIIEKQFSRYYSLILVQITVASKLLWPASMGDDLCQI